MENIKHIVQANFSYCPDAGLTTTVGNFVADGKGGLKIRIEGRYYPAHNIVFLMLCGEAPMRGQVHFIDGDRSNLVRTNLYFKKVDKLSPQYVLSKYIYDPSTGELISKNGVKGTDNGKGYLRHSLDGQHILVHHLVWLIEKGEQVPAGYELDHIDRNKHNNRIDNLRLVPQSTNNYNKDLRKDNTSGHAGVTWSDASQKWMVRIGSKYLGVYSDKGEAIAVRKAAEESL